MRKLLLLLVAPTLVQAQTYLSLPDYDWLSLLCDPANSTLTDEVYVGFCGVQRPDLAVSEEIVPPLETASSVPETVSAPLQDPPISVELSSSEQWVPRSGSASISWQSSGATSCTASGDWSGAKPVHGTVSMDALTADKVYKLTCVNETETSISLMNVYIQQAVLSWEPPTENIDASALVLSDLDGYRVYWGTASRTYENTLDVEDPAQMSLVLKLTPGTYYFAITAITTAGEESPYSGEGHKIIN